MSDFDKQIKDKIRRTINCEMVRMEDDFDTTRSFRTALTAKIMQAAQSVVLLDDSGQTREDTDTGLRIVTTALKALSDTEKANTQAIAVKLKQSEQEIASSAAAKDRIAIVIAATAPGRITDDHVDDNIEATLEALIGDDIKDFETKISPRDLSE